MVIADIRATAIYAEAPRTLGASNIERQRLGVDSGGAIRSRPQPSDNGQVLLTWLKNL
jgi:hypothetical protein